MPNDKSAPPSNFELSNALLLWGEQHKALQKQVETNFSTVTDVRMRQVEILTEIRLMKERLGPLNQNQGDGLIGTVVQLITAFFSAKNVGYIAVTALAIAFLYFTIWQDGFILIIDLFKPSRLP